MSRWIAIWSAIFALSFAPCGFPAEPEKTTLTVFGAASVTNVLQDLGDAFTRETSIAVKFSFAASSTLARQIENGAPADIFISADLDWMDYLDARKLLSPGTRSELLRNRLVLIAPANSKAELKIGPGFTLAAALGQDKLALANPDSVPAGKYGKQALESLGVWAGVEKQVARCENVRAAMTLVSRGEAPFGIVYTTDALADKNVRIVDTFPENTHSPIVYPIAIVATSTSRAAKSLLDFLASPAASSTWQRYGFQFIETNDDWILRST